MNALRTVVQSSRALELSSITPGRELPCYLRLLWDLETLANAISQCRRNGNSRQGTALHSVMTKTGSSRDTFIANNLVSLYAESGLLSDAQRLFDEMPEKNVVSWTTAICMCTRAGVPGEALTIFARMLDFGQEVPNGHTLSAALKACGAVRDLELGRWIHRHIVSLGLQHDTVLMNAALDMYIKCGSLHEARGLFDEMPACNSTSWNTMIAGCAEWGEMEEAENLFSSMPKPDVVSYNTVITAFAQSVSPKALQYLCQMHLDGIKLDWFSFPSSLKCCGGLGFENLGKEIHCNVIKSGYELDSLTASALIDMYAKQNKIDEGRQLYSLYRKIGLSGFDMSAVSNSMVSGLVSNERYGHAFALVSQMHNFGIALDEFTLSSALKACIGLQNLRLGLQVHALVVVSGFYLDYIVGSILVDLYMKCGILERAFILFRDLPEKDVVAWSGLITGCVQHGANKLALSLFTVMMSLNIEVDHFVLSSIFKACSNLAGSYGGKQVHAYSIKMGFELESAIATSLIDMYSKSGEIQDGLTVFKNAKTKDTLCWTAIIVGCGQNGKAEAAVGFFREMMKSTAEPNEVTFLAVLSACRHAGMVEDSCIFFKIMIDEYSMVPGPEHYCCMVDVLGRAGLVREAWSLIVDMPHKPDEIIWNSFIASCGTYNLSDISKLPMEHLLAIPSCSASMLVALSNSYASQGMWDKTTELRYMIRKFGMKEPGMSRVEVTT